MQLMKMRRPTLSRVILAMLGAGQTSSIFRDAEVGGVMLAGAGAGLPVERGGGTPKASRVPRRNQSFVCEARALADVAAVHERQC